MRKQSRMSQEKLSEKLNVSRQAVTKWETGGGIPDIENMIAISDLFNISIDELLSVEKNEKTSSEYLYESMTEYDIDQNKHFDMKLGGVSMVVISGYEGEKIRVKMASNTISDIRTAFKVKIDDIKSRIDVDVKRFGKMSEATAKESLCIFVNIPEGYTQSIDIESNARCLRLENLKVDNIEFDGKTSEVIIDNVGKHIELNCNLDMDIVCNSLDGVIDINQIAATSKIFVPKDADFIAVTKGYANVISYEVDGNRADSFCRENAANVIELNGIKSELVIGTVSQQNCEVG